MSTPTTRDVHIDQALSNVSIKYTNAGLIAEKLFTPITVTKDSNVYFIYGKQNFKVFNLLRAPGTRGKEVEWTISQSAAYSVKEYSAEMKLVDEVRDNADDPIKYDADTTEYATEIVMLDTEKRLADAAQNTANYATGHYETLSGGDKWSDYTNSDPIKKVREIKETIRNKIFRYPNKLIVSSSVHRYLLDHPKILERIKYSQLGVTTEQLLARIFEIDEYIVGGAGYDSANEGGTETMTNIWGNSVIAAYVTPTPGIKQLSFAYLFRRQGYRMVERWREDGIRADWIRVSDKYDYAIVSNVAGYLLKSVV